MAQNSKIEWCDHTFNPWQGCIKVSPGCQNCYAETLSNRWGKDIWGPGAKRQRTSAAYWKKPLQWDKQAIKEGRRFKVFCASMADVFEDNPQLTDWRNDLFTLIEQTPNLDWLLLTKRPENVNRMVAELRSDCYWLEETISKGNSNVWIGTSVEDQEYAGRRIPELLKIPAPTLFLSCEPLLGPLDLEGLAYEAAGPEWAGFNRLVDWVIVGGESGHNARPMHPDWARSLRDQCQAAGVAFHFKQWGEFVPLRGHREHLDLPLRNREWRSVQGEVMVRVGKHAAGRLLDGYEWNEFPETRNR